MKKLIGASLVVLGFHATAAMAAPPPALKSAIQFGQLTVLEEFSAASGMTGYVVSPGGGAKPTLMFASPDGKTLLTGNVVMIGEQGDNLTEAYANKYIPKPDYKGTYEKLGSASVVQTGKKGDAPVYVFLDPNCVYCNFAYQAMAPYIAKGADVRWVPVAFLKEDSAGKAAAIATAKDPAKALADHERMYKSGGIAPVKVTPEFAKVLEQNAALMAGIGAGGTPTVLYKDKDGAVQFIGGMPSLNKIPEMVGMPLIPNDNPELARFAK